MTISAKSPLDGGPATRRDTDKDGNPTLTVHPRGLTPFRAKLINRGTLVATVFGTSYGLWEVASQTLFSQVSPPAVEWAVALGGPVACLPLIRWILRFLWAKTALMFTPNEFKVRGFWSTKRFSRDAPHDFSLIPHDRAAREREALAYWDQKWMRFWWTLPIRRYYGNSFHVSFNYMGQRNDIITVYGRGNAAAIQMRLKACDDIVNSAAHRGGGVATCPQDEWAGLPGGDLPTSG